MVHNPVEEMLTTDAVLPSEESAVESCLEQFVIPAEVPLFIISTVFAEFTADANQLAGAKELACIADEYVAARSIIISNMATAKIMRQFLLASGFALM